MRAGMRTTGSRGNALWGRGGRRAGVAVATMAALLVTSAAAVGAPAPAPAKLTLKLKAYVPAELLSAVQQNPRASYDVILQGDPQGRSSTFFKQALQESASRGQTVGARQVTRRFVAINGGRATLTGWQILALGMSRSVKSIVANETVQKADVGALPLANAQKQLWAAKAPVNWTASALSTQAPTIAVVDSGLDATRSDFGGRVLGQVSLASLGPNSPGDGYGHGTFVGGIAAGAAAGHAGVAPTANLLSVDVMSDAGEATVADVVAACDWILQHKTEYNIKVANFSLHATNPASVFFDPLDRAVERLWLNGVVVVAAAGNYGTGATPSNVPFAPGNDPFIITVGAADILNTIGAADDVAAPWSAYGYSLDGFAKPELSAPGRYIIGPVPEGATLATQRADHVVEPGYMQLSGTSFAAPAVAGTAALLLAAHPDWTPDQVKGALMASATPTPAVQNGSLGVGELNNAAALQVSDPPNPNAGLAQFLTTDATGARVFDAALWQSAASSSAAWGSAAWSSAAWSSAAWGSAAWGSAAWSSAAWSSAAWGSAAWSDAAWSDAAWADAAWADAAWASSAGVDPTLNSPITDDEANAVLVELGLLASPVAPLEPPAPPAPALP
jgi:serine protease AprX